MKKAKQASEASRLGQIPNVGVSIVKDLGVIGISKPTQLKGQDGIALYYKLGKSDGPASRSLSGRYNDGCGRFYERREPETVVEAHQNQKNTHQIGI